MRIAAEKEHDDLISGFTTKNVIFNVNWRLKTYIQEPTPVWWAVQIFRDTRAARCFSRDQHGSTVTMQNLDHCSLRVEAANALEVKKNWEQFFPSSPRLCAMDTSVPTKKAPGKLIVGDSWCETYPNTETYQEGTLTRIDNAKPGLRLSTYWHMCSTVVCCRSVIPSSPFSHVPAIQW